VFASLVSYVILSRYFRACHSASFASGMPAAQAAEILCDLALRLGSSDNVTAVIVQFSHHFRSKVEG
jgi:serine/threonine protein phosphatase PrpC